MDSVAGMRVLVRVVDAGGFSAAARQLGVAPSSISRQITDLESELGIRLFSRTTRKLSLTEAGTIYYERARQIINDVDEARLAVSELGAPTGILRVTVPSGIGRNLIIAAIPAFLQHYPGIRIVLSMTDYLVDLVEGGYDIGIRVGPLIDSSLKARKIGESARVVCASPAYLKRAGTPAHPADLAMHNCITFRDHPGQNVWKFLGKDGSTEVRVSGSFFAKSADALSAAAVAGLGLVLLPDWNIRWELQQKLLEVVLTEYETVPPATPIWAVHSHQRHVPSKIRAFIDFLADELKDH